MNKDALVSVLTREMDRVAKNPENWQERMNALVEMHRCFEDLDTTGSLTMDVWKILKPLKLMLQDLRSQIVKEVCHLLTIISKTTKDSMAPFLREILPTLLEVRGSGNKVCAAYCSDCIETVVVHTVIKGQTLRLFVDMLLESKNKAIRLCCITSLKFVLATWSAMLDKNDVQQLEKGLKNALYDASSSCRSQSHEFFQLFHLKFPKRAAILMTMIDYKIQKRLEAYMATEVLTLGAFPPGPSTTGSASVDENGPSATEQSLSGFNVEVGDRVCIPEKELFGFVRFLGEIEGAKGSWVGVELDGPHGKNDGSVKGRYYFRCKPKHGVFARPHHVFLTISGSKLHQQQVQEASKLDALNDDASVVLEETLNDEMVAMALQDELNDTSISSYPDSPPPAKAPDSIRNGTEDDAVANHPSALSVVLTKASIAHRRYLDKLLVHVRSELEEHQRFENYIATASSADAVQYLQQLQNCAQDKIVLSDMFIQYIIQAQQAARES